MTTTNLTASQTRNLEIIRAAGGTLVSRRGNWFVPGSTTRLKGLSIVSVDNLIKAGMVRAFNAAGVAMSAVHGWPARIELAA